MNESKGKPEEVFIDFGAGSCTAACNHCLFGLDKKKETVTPQQLRLYELVETYAKERDAFVSTGLMDPIETFEADLSFIKYAESVRISTRDIMTYFRGFETGEGVAKIKSVLGSALGVPWSLAVSVHTENSPARFLTHNDMVSIFALQIKLAEVCDADIAFGFRTNRSSESTEQVFQSMQRMGRRYRKAIKEFLPEADVKMRSLKRGGLASLSVQARLGRLRGYLNLVAALFIQSTPKKKRRQLMRTKKRMVSSHSHFFPVRCTPVIRP